MTARVCKFRRLHRRIVPAVKEMPTEVSLRYDDGLKRDMFCRGAKHFLHGRKGLGQRVHGCCRYSLQRLIRDLLAQKKPAIAAGFFFPVSRSVTRFLFLSQPRAASSLSRRRRMYMNAAIPVPRSAEVAGSGTFATA
jgi:hypothetical protein